MGSKPLRPFCVPAAVVSCVAAFALTGTSAVGADTPSDPPESSSEIDRVLAPTENDDILATLQMLEAAGINELDSPYKGLTVVENRGDHLVVHYTAGTANSDAIVRAVEQVAAAAPAKVVAQATDVNPGRISELAGRIADSNDPVGHEHGIMNVTSVSFDQLTGVITVHVDDPAFTKPRELLIEGLSVTVVSDGTKHVLSNRINDSPNWSGGINMKHDSSILPTYVCGAGFNWKKWVPVRSWARRRSIVTA